MKATRNLIALIAGLFMFFTSTYTMADKYCYVAGMAHSYDLKKAFYTEILPITYLSFKTLPEGAEPTSGPGSDFYKKISRYFYSKLPEYDSYDFSMFADCSSQAKAENVSSKLTAQKNFFEKRGFSISEVKGFYITSLY